MSLRIHGLGSLVYYFKSGEFYAYCHGEGHSIDQYGRPCYCRKNRIGKKTKSETGPAGRPVGFRYTWMKEAVLHGDNDDHMENFLCDHGNRALLRDEFEGLPPASELLKWEREQRTGEAKEPLSIP